MHFIFAWANRFYRFLTATETLILIVLLLSMIVIAVIQIIMRNLFSSGILWAESYVRIAVLWIAMLGAMIASRGQQHIAIDAVVRYLPSFWQNMVQRLTDLFTAAVCFAVSYYSMLFVQYEMEDGGLAFSQVPNWVCEAVIPFAFAVMGLRYLIASVFALKHVKENNA